MMVRTKIAAFLFVLSFLSALLIHPCPGNTNEGEAAESLGTRLGPEEAADAVKKIKEIQANINSITAAVYQKKKNPLLKDVVETRGTITLQKPNLLHWDVLAPERSTIILDGSFMWVYRPDAKEAKRYTIAEQFIVRQTMEFFTSTMSMSLEEMSKQFNVSLYSSGSGLVFELKPKSSIVATYLAAVHIWYQEGEGMPHKFEVMNKKGGQTITEFSAIVLNPPIEKNFFHFDAPAGVVVTHIENEKKPY